VSKTSVRSVLVPALTALGLVALDLLLDRLILGRAAFSWSHFVVSAAVVTTVVVAMHMAMVARGRTLATIRQARDELEARVQERTSALAAANDALRAEIAERQRLEQALRASEARYRALFDSFPEPFTVWSRDGVLLMQNLKSAANLGGNREDYIGKTMHSIFGAAAEGYLARIVGVIDTGITETGEDAVDLPTGRRYFWTSIKPIDVPGVDTPAAQVISYDITQRVESQQAYECARDELAHAAQQLAAEGERQRLARDLHDSVSQALYGVALGANTALRVLDTDRSRTLTALNYVVSMAEAALAEMRSLVLGLRPGALETEGLTVALKYLVAALRVRYTLDVELSLCDEPDAPPAIKDALYHICQEAIHNAARHAAPTKLGVSLTRTLEGLQLEVRDDGVGFDHQVPHPGHFGLRSMRERAASVGGSLEITSAPGLGTHVRVSVPLAHAVGGATA
jgi:PAS domain S-box-containing protein